MVLSSSLPGSSLNVSCTCVRAACVADEEVEAWTQMTAAIATEYIALSHDKRCKSPLNLKTTVCWYIWTLPNNEYRGISNYKNLLISTPC